MSKQFLPFFGFHPGLEMVNRIVADNIHPLLLELASRFERISRQITGVACLRSDRLAPPGAVVVSLSLVDTMREDHRDWRFGVFITGKDLEVRRFYQAILYPRR